MPASRKPSGTEEALIFLLANPLRRRLFRLYVEATEKRSPKQLTVPVNRDVSIVSYHVRVLAEHGAVELVDTEPRRGAVEHFYKATSLVDEVPWARAVLGLTSP
ncbi:MAG TPA: helix-turn-helix domain-containing protein [Solirubrobacterales bacterium]|nr:helix-turn-helix domain-containing protein [Solirubrobacterales bacterium]